MDTNEKLKTKRSDDGWLSTLIPIAITAVVSVITTMTYLKFVEDQPTPEAISSPLNGVLVFELSDWIQGVPASSTPEEMEQHFMRGRAAADKAAELGYVVLDSTQLITYPDSMKLTPTSVLVPKAPQEGDR